MVKYLTTLFALWCFILSTQSANVIRFTMVEEKEEANMFEMFRKQDNVREDYVFTRRQFEGLFMVSAGHFHCIHHADVLISNYSRSAAHFVISLLVSLRHVTRTVTLPVV